MGASVADVFLVAIDFPPPFFFCMSEIVFWQIFFFILIAFGLNVKNTHVIFAVH